MRQQYSSIEQIQLVLRVKKQSQSGLFKNYRLLAIKSGYISYYSRVPKQFVGNTRSLQLIGQFPKYTLSAQHITKITYHFPLLQLEFEKNKLINKSRFKSIIDQTQDQLQKGSMKNNSEKVRYWRFKSKQIDLANAFVAQVQTCMRQQTMNQLNNTINNYENNNNQPHRGSLQPSLKMVSNGFKVAQEERQSKQISQIINQRASQYFTSEQIQHDLKKRVTDLGFIFKKNNQLMEKKSTKKKVVKDAQFVKQIRPIQVPQPFVDTVNKLKSLKKESKEEKTYKNRVEQISLQNESPEEPKLIDEEEKKDNKISPDQMIENGSEDYVQQIHRSQDYTQNQILNQVQDERKDNTQDVPQDHRQNEAKDFGIVESSIKYQAFDQSDQININHKEPHKQQHQQLYQADYITSQPLFETNQQQINFTELQNQSPQQILEQEQPFNQQKVQVFQQSNERDDNIERIDELLQVGKGGRKMDENECNKMQNKVGIVENQECQLEEGQSMNYPLQYELQKQVITFFHEQQTIHYEKQTFRGQNFTNQVQNSQNYDADSNNLNKCANQEIINIQEQRQFENVVKKQVKQQQLGKKQKTIKLSYKQKQKQKKQFQSLQSQTYSNTIEFAQDQKQRKSNISQQQRLKLHLAQQFIVNIQSLGYSSEDINEVDNSKQTRKHSKFESVKQINVNFNDLFLKESNEKPNKGINKFCQLRNNKQEKFIMFTDFINYPSLLTTQNMKSTNQQLKNDIFFDSSNIAFSNQYQSRLYDKFLFSTTLIESNSDYGDIYYMRYKNYQALVGPTEEMRQIDVLFDKKSRGSSKNKRVISKRETRQQQQGSEIEQFQQSQQLCQVVSPNNVFKAYPSLEMIKRVCIEQLCLYLKTHSLVSSSFNTNNNKDPHHDIEHISQSIMRRNQLKKLLNSHSPENENSQQMRLFINRVILSLLQELVGIQSVIQQGNHQPTAGFTIRIVENAKCHNKNDGKSILGEKYHVKQLYNQSMIMLEQNRKYQIKQLMSVNKNKVNQSHKLKQNTYIHNSKSNYYQENILSDLTTHQIDHYFQTYKSIIRLYSNSCIFKIVQCKDQSLLKLFKQEDISQFSTFNHENIKLMTSLCSYIQNIVDEFGRFEEKAYTKQSKSSSILSIKQLNAYLSQKSITMSINLLKLQTLASFYNKITAQKINSSDRLTIEGLSSSANINSVIEQFITQEKAFIQELRRINMKRLLQKATQSIQISDLKSVSDYVCSVVTHFCSITTTLISQLKACVNASQQQTVVVNHHKLVVIHGLQLVNALQKISNINDTNNNSSPQYNYQYKYRLEITNLIYNPQQMNIELVMQLLISTINQKDNAYFFKSLQLLMKLWKHSTITDSLLVQTFAAISQTDIFHNPIYNQKVRSFLDNEIKTQDKINFINKHPILQCYYRQS